MPMDTVDLGEQDTVDDDEAEEDCPDLEYLWVVDTRTLQLPCEDSRKEQATAVAVQVRSDVYRCLNICSKPARFSVKLRSQLCPLYRILRAYHTYERAEREAEYKHCRRKLWKVSSVGVGRPHRLYSTSHTFKQSTLRQPSLLRVFVIPRTAMLVFVKPFRPAIQNYFR